MREATIKYIGTRTKKIFSYLSRFADISINKRVENLETEENEKRKKLRGADHIYSAMTLSVESERSRLTRSESTDIVFFEISRE